MGLIRGGRQVVDDLKAQLAALNAYRHEAQEALIRNPRKAELALDDIGLVTRELERLVVDVIEPMLAKRDARAERNLADVVERIAQIEARLAAIERRDRSPIPLRQKQG